MFDDGITCAEKSEAIELFRRAYAAQLRRDYARAEELYRQSIETYPTAEAHTFLGWTYSFQERYDEAIAECLKAIETDPAFGNPYNDIGSYLIAKGDIYGCVRWFKRALTAPRYESYAYPHFNLGRAYEQRGRLIEAARHYNFALKQRGDYQQAEKALRRVQMKLN
jgi:tetratricopeptide (TPR) repeat protein